MDMRWFIQNQRRSDNKLMASTLGRMVEINSTLRKVNQEFQEDHELATLFRLGLLETCQIRFNQYIDLDKIIDLYHVLRGFY